MPETFNFADHLARQREFSERTFGPGARAKGICDHIRKELREIESDPADLSEWIDVVILALDGAWRSGATPDQIIAALVTKQTRNESRTWPDWRKASPDYAIEHKRSCNRHDNCDEAERKRLERFPGTSVPPTFHCYDEECEECFGN